MGTNAIWSCKIGEVDSVKLPHGSDLPMRQAVERAYRELTGEEPEFTFSGWGAPCGGYPERVARLAAGTEARAELDERERAESYVWLVWGGPAGGGDSILLAAWADRDDALDYEKTVIDRGARGKPAEWFFDVWTTPWRVQRRS